MSCFVWGQMSIENNLEYKQLFAGNTVENFIIKNSNTNFKSSMYFLHLKPLVI